MNNIERVIQLCQREVAFALVRSSGPGGQNVNKVATAVQLRFDVSGSDVLDAESKKRLAHAAGRRLTARGLLVIEADRYRTQARNRADALGRFTTLLKKSLTPPKVRHKTKASAASQERRLQTKKIRGQIKRARRKATYD